MTFILNIKIYNRKDFSALQTYAEKNKHMQRKIKETALPQKLLLKITRFILNTIADIWIWWSQTLLISTVHLLTPGMSKIKDWSIMQVSVQPLANNKMHKKILRFWSVWTLHNNKAFSKDKSEQSMCNAHTMRKK